MFHLLDLHLYDVRYPGDLYELLPFQLVVFPPVASLLPQPGDSEATEGLLDLAVRRDRGELGFLEVGGVGDQVSSPVRL